MALAAACAERNSPPRATPARPPAATPAPATGGDDASRPKAPETGEAGRGADPGARDRGTGGRADRGRSRPAAVGLASFYGKEFEGKLTASGTVFDKDELVAAHPSYPFGTRVRVVNLDNGRSVVVRIVDRGPTQENVNEGVIIDVSRRAAEVLGFVMDGRQKVRLVVLEWGS
jgi:rare lipoprotein A